jgi:ribonuclease HI
MSKKHYVVWKGVKAGIYTSWPEAKKQIDGRSDAQYMGFPNQAEAEAAFKSTYTKALMQRSLAKGKSSSTYSANKVNASHTGAKSRVTATKRSTATIQVADVNIYCDGACSPNPGKSGTGIAIYEKKDGKACLTSLWYGLFEPNGTNNTAELNGLLKAFLFAQDYLSENNIAKNNVAKGNNDEAKQVQVLSDSKYSIDCITKWAKGWQAKGWTRGKGETIKNLELIKTCFALYQQIKTNLIITHVKGHANIEGNELSDRMAVLARSKKEADFVPYTATLDIETILAMTGD